MKNKSGRSKVITKKEFVCNDGPWSGESLWLVTGCTLVMNISGQIGRYIGHRHDPRMLVWQPSVAL